MVDQKFQLICVWAGKIPLTTYIFLAGSMEGQLLDWGIFDQKE